MNSTNSNNNKYITGNSLKYQLSTISTIPLTDYLIYLLNTPFAEFKDEIKLYNNILDQIEQEFINML